MVTALKCPHCSAALPAPTPGASFVQCSFCGGVAQLAAPGAAPSAVVAPRVAQPAPPSGPTREDRDRFVAAFNSEVAGGERFIGALQSAARQALAGFGDQSAMVFAVAHLAVDFERESGAQVQRDGVVVSRLTEAYYKAANELARSHTAETEINLPFLAATQNGPMHLSRTVTLADLARMTAGPPSPAPAQQPEPPAAPAPEPEKKKKKGWFW